MKKIILTLLLMIITATSVFAAKLPDELKGVIKKDFPRADFRFDGVVILPDGTLYLPLYPSLIKKPEKLEIKTTYPTAKTLAEKPEIVIFNNDFVLMKVLIDSKGRKTVLNLANPPLEIKSGLLPQDMLVPKGLVVPDNIKGIIGNLLIPTAQDAGLRVKADNIIKTPITPVAPVKAGVIPELRDKVIYVSTCYSKNVQVIHGESRMPEYALAQKAVPIDIEVVGDDKFLLVTMYDKTFVDVISLADERQIKQIDLTTQPEEIVYDKVNNLAYVSSSKDSSVYIIDLNDMSLKKKIKVKGACEKLYITPDGKKLFYADKKTNDVWVVELNNKYLIKNIGKFPNVSKITYAQNKIYISSRSKNRLAIIDYATMSLIHEMDVSAKPVDMLVYKDNLYVLSAQNNIVQVISTVNDMITDTIYLNTAGFSTKIHQIKNTNKAIVADTKAGKYSILDLDKKQVIKTNQLDVPVSVIIVSNRIKKITK